MSDTLRVKIRASVGCVIHELPKPPSLSAVRSHLFPKLKLDENIEEVLRKEHASQLRVVQLTHMKNIIVKAMAADEASVAELFPASTLKEALLCDTESRRLVSAIEEDSMETVRLFQELEEFRQKLDYRQQSDEAEPAFRRALMEWLTSGEPSQEMWKALCQWRTDGAGLASFRRHVQEHFPIDPKGLLRRMIAASKKLRGHDEFVDILKVQRILNECSDPSAKLHEGHLQVKGAVVALSLAALALDRALSSIATRSDKKANVAALHTVSIYAADCCSLDASLDQRQWAGINLCIVTKRLFVHDGIVIDLSGSGFEPRPASDRSARNAHIPEEAGADGQSGRAGESSGNLLIMTRDERGRGKSARCDAE